jgi:hypothetical protein
MMQQREVGQTRRGATTVEFAVVASLFFLFLFGILEYGRFVFIRHLMDNAAREGARLAVVSTADPSLLTEIQARVDHTMAGFTTLPNYSRTAYRTDSSGNNLGPPQDAVFGEWICVEVEADFNPVLPQFIFMGNIPHMRSRAYMHSEAN